MAQKRTMMGWFEYLEGLVDQKAEMSREDFETLMIYHTRQNTGVTRAHAESIRDATEHTETIMGRFEAATVERSRQLAEVEERAAIEAPHSHKDGA